MLRCGWLLKCNYIVGTSEQNYCGYGNYNTESVKVSNDNTIITIKPQGTTQKLKTGQCSYTNSNNIYDLAGNCYERTQESVNSSVRIFRGGHCSNAYRSNC